MIAEGSGMQWDAETDILVFGSGAAGMTAALVGAHEGLRVILCEKLTQIGGTTATSAGTLWIPNNSLAGALGINDSFAEGSRYLTGEIGQAQRPALIHAFLESGPKAVDYLQTHTDVQFDVALKHPDYHPDAPGGLPQGRALTPKPFDGRSLGQDFMLIRPPRQTLTIFGGMMVGRREVPSLLRPFSSFSNFSYVARILLRHASDRLRYRRGTRLILGNALVARFLRSLRKRNVPIWTNAALTELVKENGCVVGAVVEVDGTARHVRARCGVVLATGGFPGKLGERAEFTSIPEVRSYAFPDSKGDGMRVARSAGAAVEGAPLSPAWWTPVSVLKNPDGSELLWAHHSLDRGKPGLVAVNSSGQRFVNEACSYHDFVEAMIQSHKSVPSIPAFLVCDRRFLRRNGLGLIKPLYQRLQPYLHAGYLHRGGSITELAQTIGVDAAGLEATIRKHNDYANTGEDADFQKGSGTYDLHMGDPAHLPNPCLGPIEHSPFFAVAVYPGVIGTCVGIKTDEHARVLDDEDNVIAGLYSSGNDMSSVMRGSYPGPGITLGPAITFAYRAVMNMVSKD